MDDGARESAAGALAAGMAPPDARSGSRPESAHPASSPTATVEPSSNPAHLVLDRDTLAGAAAGLLI